MRLLLVEDDAHVAEAEKEELEAAGFEVEWCASKAQALETLDLSFTAVVTDRDLGMGGGGATAGEQVVRKAQELHLPVIMVTGNANGVEVDCPILGKRDLGAILPAVIRAMIEQRERTPQNHKLVSTVRVELLGSHAHLGIWSRGGKSGTLIVNADDADDMVDRLRGPETTVEVVR